jgi:hypothetical protein
MDKSGNICGKKGRYNSEKYSRNTNHKFAKKFEYMQFMHNDGSKKHYIPMKEYLSNLYKGHPFEGHLNLIYDAGSVYSNQANQLRKTVDIVKRHYEKFTQQEKLDFQEMILFLGNLSLKTLRFNQIYVSVLGDYLMKGKLPPTEITKEFEELGQEIRNVNPQRDFHALISIIEKYEIPRRRKNWKMSYEKQKNWPLGSTHIRKGIKG